MPRYHFNVFDGRSEIDSEGTQLCDQNEARREAIRLSGALLEDEADRLKMGEEWRMEVTDHAGLVLFRLGFLVSEGASGKPG